MMPTIRRRMRWLLLGPEDSWGATLATGQAAITALAALAVFTHVLDLASGVRMMLVYGVHMEQNPIARALMLSGGPLRLAEVKLLIVMAGVLLFMRTARAGRP